MAAHAAVNTMINTNCAEQHCDGDFHARLTGQKLNELTLFPLVSLWETGALTNGFRLHNTTIFKITRTAKQGYKE